MEPAAPLAILLGIGPLIGAALARRFARGGFRTALVGLDPVFLEALAGSLPGARGYVRDLGEPGAVPEVMAAIAREQGEAQVLVWHASAGVRGTASTLDPQVLARDLRLNAIAPLEAVQQVLPAMRRSGQGTLLFTGGGLALKPEAGLASGSTGKAALRQLALCLAAELAPEGIHAATVTVAGFVREGSSFEPDGIAEQFWVLHVEPREDWRPEVVLSPPRP